MDPGLTREYARLLRLVTVVHHLEKRRRTRLWTEPVSLGPEEDRLRSLHTALGFTDSLLEPDPKTPSRPGPPGTPDRNR